MKLTFSILVIYKIIFFAILLFVFFRFLFFSVSILLKSKKKLKIAKRNLPILEFFIWLIFSIWVFKEFLIYNQYFALIIFIIMLTISIISVKIVLKDYIAGVIIKLDSSIVLGDTITSSNFTGVISNFNYRTLELELQNKSLIKIPYSKILNNKLIKEKRSNTISGYSFNLTTSKEKSVETLIKSIKKTAVLLPWVSIKQQVEINTISETDNTYLFEISLYSYNKDMYFKIEKHIKDKFEI